MHEKVNLDADIVQFGILSHVNELHGSIFDRIIDFAFTFQTDPLHAPA